MPSPDTPPLISSWERLGTGGLNSHIWQPVGKMRWHAGYSRGRVRTRFAHCTWSGRRRRTRTKNPDSIQACLAAVTTGLGSEKPTALSCPPGGPPAAQASLTCALAPEVSMVASSAATTYKDWTGPVPPNTEAMLAPPTSSQCDRNPRVTPRPALAPEADLWSDGPVGPDPRA